jgi:hypothetical protein
MNAAATAEATRVRMVVIGISPAFQNSDLAADGAQMVHRNKLCNCEEFSICCRKRNVTGEL